ncbi:MAG: DUF1080 domain-containing protein [Vicinamibacterales bacterium]
MSGRRAAGGLLAAVLVVANLGARTQESSDWVTLLDGSTIEGWLQTGSAKWRTVDGAIEGTSGPGFLVTPRAYRDFDLYVEVWVASDANSGVFFRAEDAKEIVPTSAYEVNLFDHRPDPKYRTGAIVDVAEPSAKVDVGDRWNTVEVQARGEHLKVAINGVSTVDASDGKHVSGPIALQAATGT